MRSRTCSPKPSASRSYMSVVSPTVQPLLTPPSTWLSWTRTLSKKTSLNSASPVSCRSGFTVTPGAFMSSRKYVMPLCFGASGSVRARSIIQSAMCASDVHTFWPLMIQCSPSFIARVWSEARSDPAFGSE
jgi:hypothetical protein